MIVCEKNQLFLQNNSPPSAGDTSREFSPTTKDNTLINKGKKDKNRKTFQEHVDEGSFGHNKYIHE